MNQTVTPEYLDLVEQALLTLGESAPDTVEQVLSLPKMKLFSGALKASETAEGARVFRCTASSTTLDLHGDYMTEDCVRDMARQAKQGPVGKGLTIFLNHKYSVPEDVAGKVADTQVLTRAKDDKGVDIWDMDYVVRLAKGTPGDRLDKTWSLIHDDEITLGISIGAYILEYDFIDKDEGFWGGLVINKVLLVETSIVGIPANQRSWIQNGVISIGKSLGYDEKQIRRVLDGKEAAPVKNLIASGTTGFVAASDSGTVTTGAQVVLSGTPTILTIEDQAPITDDATVEASADAEVISDDAAPVQESTAESTDDTTTEEPDGETTEASAPALADAAPDVALSLDAGSKPALELVLAALEAASAEVKQLRAEKTELESQVLVLTGERDQAIKDRDIAAEIVETIAKSPLGRKTQFAGPVATFKSQYSGIYDERFLSLLDSNETE